MGEVWLGRHVVTGGIAAVKLLRESSRGRDRLRRYFAREGRAVRRLSHAHIVSLFEVGEDHLVTGFIDGSDLARRLRTPFPAIDAVRVTSQIAAALAHAHGRGVIHRDVKPSNILLDARGNAYLADFGLAVLVDDIESDASTARAGTPVFMAPEQLRGEPASPAADQYALGRTVMAMLLGVLAPPANAEALAQLPAGTPTALIDALGRATAARAGERFPSVAAFAEALAAIDLSGLSAEPRLAAEVRPRAAFGWASVAHHTERHAPDLECASYRLTDIIAAGLIDGAPARALLARHGVRDLGFTVYAREARLGSIVDSAAWARAAEVVVLMHGWSLPRETWAEVAAAICRDNAQAIVLAPDMPGHRDTLFERRTPRVHEASLDGWVDTLRELLGLLAAAELPTVLVGHSMMAAALLARADDHFGANVSRIAINPVWPGVDRLYRFRLWVLAATWIVLAPMGRLARGVMHMMIEHGRPTHELVRPLRELITGSFLGMPAGVVLRMVGGIRRLGVSPGPHRRLQLILGLVDPMARPVAIERGVRRLGIGGAQVQRLASANHFPQMELEPRPEQTARNVAEIVRTVDTMLLSAREGTLMSTQCASTMLDTTSEGASAVVAVLKKAG